MTGSSSALGTLIRGTSARKHGEPRVWHRSRREAAWGGKQRDTRQSPGPREMPTPSGPPRQNRETLFLTHPSLVAAAHCVTATTRVPRRYRKAPAPTATRTAAAAPGPAARRRRGAVSAKRRADRAGAPASPAAGAVPPFGVCMKQLPGKATPRQTHEPPVRARFRTPGRLRPCSPGRDGGARAASAGATGSSTCKPRGAAAAAARGRAPT